MPHDLLKKFESEREKCSKERQGEMIGNVADSGRRGSYVDHDIIFTQSGAAELIKSKDVSQACSTELKRGLHPLNIKFIQWQKSNVG